LLHSTRGRDESGMGFLKTAWWGCRIAVAFVFAIVLLHNQVAETKTETPCDAPLLGYIAVAGLLNLLVIVLRTVLLVIGYSDDPSNFVQFLILYPVALHFVELCTALIGAGYVVMPRECEPGYATPYVWLTVFFVLMAFINAGYLYPLMFNTRYKGKSSDRKKIVLDPDTSRHAAGRLFRDAHSYFLMYRTLSAFVVLVTYCVARGDVPIGIKIETYDRCSDALVVWFCMELVFHLLTYCATLYYAIRALLFPKMLFSLHVCGFWFFVMFQVFWGALGSYLVLRARQDACFEKDKAISSMVAAAVAMFWICISLTLCFTPCWRPNFTSRASKAEHALNKMHVGELESLERRSGI